MYSNRKSILNNAKNIITVRHQEDIEALYEKLTSLIDEIGDEYHDDPSYLKAQDEYNSALKKFNEWNAAAKAKKKKSITWTSDHDRKIVRNSKPRKKINWDAASEVIEENKSIIKNNRAWLSEGGIVFHKDNPDQLMMVVEVKNSQTRVLIDGEVKSLRTLSLRPAFD